MHGINYSGGDNKTHGQIEQAERIDSFEAGKVTGCGKLIVYRNGIVAHVLHCDRCGQAVKLSSPGGRWRDTLELGRVPSGFGGTRAFWLCPRCGRRARYLYLGDRGFVCRECAKLNYRSQQHTGDSMKHFQDGMRLAREKLHWEPPAWVVPMDFPNLTPPCPRYMHDATYRRHLDRFRQYQEKYQRDTMRKLLAILGR